MPESSTRAGASHVDRAYANGLPFTNRDDISYPTYETRLKAGAWQKGDLFAVFRTEFGELRVQVAHEDDFYDYVATEMLTNDFSRVGKQVVQQDILHLICMLILSRSHPYEFENFIQLLDHTGAQLFDMGGFISWVFDNRGKLFAASDADDIDGEPLDPELLDEAEREYNVTAEF